MKNYGKRTLSLIVAMVMLLSMAGMIAPHHAHAEYIGSNTAAEFDALMNKTHPVHYQLYTADGTSNGFQNTGAGVVDDADAFGGKAMLHNYTGKVDNVDVSEGTNLYGGFGFDMNLSATTGFHLGKISANDIINDGAYHVYRSTFTIPENITSGGMVYLFGTWQIQPKGMGDHLYNWRGKTVDLYISLKVVGEKTAAYCYIDRVVLMERCEDYASASGEYCTWCGKQIVLNTVPSKRSIIADLNTTNFRIPYGDPIVDDASAHTGKAVLFSYANRAETGDTGLMNAMLRYGTKTLEFRMVKEDYKENDVVVEAGTNELVGELTPGRLNANGRAGEYVLYKFSNINLLPEKGKSGHYLYMFDCWGFQVDLAGYADQIAGKTVDVYLSMKVTGDVTNTTDNSPAYYIDRIIIATPEVPAYNADSVLAEMTVNDFIRPYGDPIVEDKDSETGSAVMYSYDLRKANKDANPDGEGIPDYNVLIQTGDRTLDMRTTSNILVGSLDIPTMQTAGAVGEYVLYKFADVTLDTSDLYMFQCWGFMISNAKYKDAVGDKTVNVYVSMKITGDVGNTTDNTPNYYIDKVIITDAAIDNADHTHYFSDWANANNDIHARICLNCGYAETEAHTWDDGVITKEPGLTEDGIKTYTCTAGCTKEEAVASEAFYVCYTAEGANKFNLAWGDPVVDDEAAFGGKAALLSWAWRQETYGDHAELNDLPSKLNYFGEMVLGMYRTDYADPAVGEIPVPALMATAKTGEYVTFKFSNADLSGADTIYMFQCWGFQIPLASYKSQLEGKLINVYVSLKITGDPTNSTDNTPDYYIDKVELIDAAYDTAAHEHTYSDLFDLDDNVHGSICTTCGELSSEGHSWDEGVVTVAPSAKEEGQLLYTCSVCGGTKIEVLEVQASPTLAWGLILEDTMSMKFMLDVTPEQAATATLDVTVNGNTQNIAVATLLDENDEAVLILKLAAAQMTDVVTLTLNLDGETRTNTYSIREYADFIMDPDNGFDAELVTLVENMLNYGAASQVFFDHNSGVLANDGIEVAPITVPTTGGSMVVTGNVAGISIVGASLVHENKTAVRLYFNAASTDGYTFGEGFKVDEKNGMFYLEKADIYPQNLDEDIVFTISDGTNTVTVEYSPLDYIIRMYNKATSSDELKAVVEALYGYYQAAEAYAG